MFLKYLAAQVKVPSKTHEYAIAARLQSYLSIINTVLSLLLATLFFSFDEGKNNILVNFSSRWYAEVSPNLFVTLVTDITLNTLLPYGLSIFKETWTCCCDRRCSRSQEKTSKYLQEDYNSLYEPEEMNIAENYSRIELNLALCLFFGPGMPIFYAATALFFLLQGCLDKSRLINYSKRPPQYDNRLAKSLTGMMSLILFLHLVGYFLTYRGPVFQETNKIQTYEEGKNSLIGNYVDATKDFGRSLQDEDNAADMSSW